MKVPGYPVISARTVMPQKIEAEACYYLSPWSAMPDPSRGVGCQIIGAGTLWIYGINHRADPVEGAPKDEITALLATNHRWTDPFNRSPYTVSDYRDQMELNFITEYPAGNPYLHYYYLRMDRRGKHYWTERGYMLWYPNLSALQKYTSAIRISGTLAPRHTLHFLNVSEEYDRYLKSSWQKMWKHRDENDFTLIFDDSMVYSNILNGTGIFGAAYTDTLQNIFGRNSYKIERQY